MPKTVRLIRISDPDEFLEKVLKPLGFDSLSEFEEEGYSFEDLKGYLVEDQSTLDLFEGMIGELIKGDVVVLIGGRWYLETVTCIKNDDGYFALEDDCENLF